jgi:5-methyltetrahydrofolate--homocysteine methyltransferase
VVQLPRGLCCVAPQRQTVIHVNDASRAVTVAGSLLNSDKKIYAASIQEEYDAFRDLFEPFER